MDIFLLFSFFGGLAVFLFGMNTMSENLEIFGVDKLERVISSAASNPLKEIVIGAGITAAVQSSSAVTVLLVGLVEAGVIEFKNAAGVIVGANIGTTLTAWITSTASIENGGAFLLFFKAENLAAVAAVGGITVRFLSKKIRLKTAGEILLGFSVLMYGMEIMKNSAAPAAQSENLKNLLTSFNNPILTVISGALFTGIIQSSSASTGILQSICTSFPLTIGAAVPIIAGQNIGTCFTAVLSSIGTGKNAKRVVVVHTAFNVLGALVFLTLFFGMNIIFHFADSPVSSVAIALIHTLFNIVSAFAFIPILVILHK